MRLMRTYAVVAVLALGAAGALAACGDDEESNTTTAAANAESTTLGKQQTKKSDKPQVPTIVVRGGKPVGGVQELAFKAGDQIRFTVQSDSADEVHVHGYDVEEEVSPGRPAVFDFPADIEGIFEGELHGSGEQIVELRVEP